MRYVGNMRKNTSDKFSNQSDKAVFPPGSIIPDRVADDSVMYEQNYTSMADNDANALVKNKGTSVYTRENMSENSESMHGLMDYDGMEFPIPQGRVLRRNDRPDSNFVGSVEDPRGFSPANGLGGRPMESSLNQTNSAMGRKMRPNAGMQGMVVCGPSVRLGDVMCMYAGKNINVEFMFGADTYVKKTGILSGAGMNFIILTDPETMEKTICDLTDMKFISIKE